MNARARYPSFTVAAVFYLAMTACSSDDNVITTPQSQIPVHSDPEGNWEVAIVSPRRSVGDDLLETVLLGDPGAAMTWRIDMTQSNSMELSGRLPICGLQLSYDPETRSWTSETLSAPGGSIPVPPEIVDRLCAIVREELDLPLPCARLDVVDVVATIDDVSISGSAVWSEDFETLTGDLEITADVTVTMDSALGPLSIERTCTIAVPVTGLRCEACIPDC